MCNRCPSCPVYQRNEIMVHAIHLIPPHYPTQTSSLHPRTLRSPPFHFFFAAHRRCKEEVKRWGAKRTGMQSNVTLRRCIRRAVGSTTFYIDFLRYVSLPPPPALLCTVGARASNKSPVAMHFRCKGVEAVGTKTDTKGALQPPGNAKHL